MKERLRKFRLVLLVLAGILVVSGLYCDQALAAASASYTTKKVDRSRTYGNGRIKAKVYYKKPVLKGNSKAVKLINQAIKKDCDKFLKSSDVPDLYRIAKDYASINGKMTLCYYADSKVTYNKNNVISIRITTSWYAGGVSSTERYGLNYSLKTGKKLSLANVCGKSSGAVHRNVVNAIRNSSEDQSYYYWNVINRYKVNKYKFYLEKNKKAKVCFGPYEISYGGWYREFTLASKYK